MRPALPTIGALVLATTAAFVFLARDDRRNGFDDENSFASSNQMSATTADIDLRESSAEPVSAAPREPRPTSPNDSTALPPPSRSLAFTRTRNTLVTTIDEHLPDLKLSETQLDDLTDATLRLRSAQQALREIPITREHAGRRALERERLAEAVADWSYVAEMTPDEWSREVARDGGVDVWDPSQPADPVRLRTIEGTEVAP